MRARYGIREWVIEMAPVALGDGDALVLVDVQVDFCPGGALPVTGGDRVVPVLNEWIARAEVAGVPVAASRDWHPAGHVSFEARGGPWPPHCVQGTEGAMFHPDLALPPDAILVEKATDPGKDSYSAFDGTRLADTLRERGVRRVFVGGLAEDVCVRATVLDALEEGFDAVLVADATAPVVPRNGAAARREMEDAGARIVRTRETTQA